MKITNTVVRAGRTIPHPTRSYSNIKTEVELTAAIEEGEDAQEAIQKLRIQAEQVVQTHQDQVCESIRKGTEIVSTLQRIQQLESELKILREREKSHQGLLFATTEINEGRDSYYDNDDQ